jgi:hypothetical protein
VDGWDEVKAVEWIAYSSQNVGKRCILKVEKTYSDCEKTEKQRVAK